MANYKRIASLIDGFNAGYETVGRVMRDKEIGDIAKTKPETIDGAFPEQSPETTQALVADQMANDSGGAEAVKIARASAGPRKASQYAMLGVKQDTPFTPEQESRARQMAMAGVLEKHGDIEGGSRLRDRVQQADANAKRASREDILFPLQVKGLERTERTAAQAEDAAIATRGINDSAGEWFKQRLTGPDGSRRAATVDDHLASSQYRAGLFAEKGMVEQAGKAADEYAARAAVKIQLESAQRGEAIKVAAARAAAGDLSGVVEFYNKFVPDGSRVTGIERGAKGEVVISRETMDGRPMAKTMMKDAGQLLAGLNTFNDPMALYNWSQNEFKNNMELRRAETQDKQLGISGGHLGIARANRDDGAPEREAKNAESRLRIKLAETEDPAEQAKLEGKIAALRSGARGGGAAADTAHMKDAKVLMQAAGLSQQTAIENVVLKPEQAYHKYYESSLKNLFNEEQAAANAAKMMGADGWKRLPNGYWTRSAAAGGSAQLKDVTPADITATAKKHGISEAEVRKRLNLPAQ